MFNFNNAVCGFYLTGTNKAWTTVNYPVLNSCGTIDNKGATGLLISVNKGGYEALKTKNSCTNPWDLNPTSRMYTENGQLLSSCTMSRPFVFTAASTIKVGMTIRYLAGFHKWPN